MALFRSSRAHTAARTVPPQRGMVASAVLVKQSQLRAVPEQRDWQTQAWEFYDRCGELRYAAQWMSNALARCRLYVGIPDDEGAGDPKPVDDAAAGTVTAPLEDLFGGANGHAEMLARLAIHLTVPGESYLVGLDDPASGERRWIVASGEEFTKSQRTVKVRLPDTNQQVEVDLDNSTVIRIWRPHARRAWEADSPVRALLLVLKELLDLTAHITATIESRLAGAGILWMPEEATLPSPNAQSGKPLHEDPGMATLIDAMITPISDRDSASAVVPIIARLPAATQGKTPAKPQYMTFATPLDEKVMALREAAIRRIAAGLDMPAEVLLGMGDSNHWTAWQLEESAIKLHIEPLMGLICQALTDRFYRPALAALGVANPDRYVVWFDASELTLRPNRTPESQELYGSGLVGPAVPRREAGFTEDDAPTNDEWRRWLLTQLTLSNVDPLNVAPFLKELGIELDLALMALAKPPAAPTGAAPGGPGAAEEPPPGQGGAGAPGGGQDAARPEVPATPGAPGTDAAPPSNRPPGRRAPAAPPGRAPAGRPGASGAGTGPPRGGVRHTQAALTAAAHPTADTGADTGADTAEDEPAELDEYPLRAVEMGVVQALATAGKKMLSWGGRRYRGQLACPAWEIHTRLPAADFDVDQLLDGAYACLDAVLGDLPCVRATVDSYVRELLATQRRHSRTALLAALTAAGCLYEEATTRAA